MSIVSKRLRICKGKGKLAELQSNCKVKTTPIAMISKNCSQMMNENSLNL